MRELLGFLHVAYRPACYLWPCWLCARAALLVLIAVLLDGEAPLVQAGLASLVLLLHIALAIHHRPLLVPLYRRLALSLDVGAWLLLLMGTLGAHHAALAPSWAAAAARPAELRASCFAAVGLLYPEAETAGLDSPSRAACTKLALPLAMAATLLCCAALALGALAADLRHYRVLSSLLQIPDAQLSATDPQSLSLAALRAVPHLCKSKRRLLSAHLRALRVHDAPPEAAAAAERLTHAWPLLCDWALQAAPHELRALQELAARLPPEGARADGCFQPQLQQALL